MAKAKDIRIFSPLDEEYTTFIGVLNGNQFEKKFEKTSGHFKDVLKWFNKRFIGSSIKDLLDETPPLLLMHFKDAEQALSSLEILKFVNKLDEDEVGGYIRNTNKIILQPGEKDDDSRKVICHELLHYSSELGNRGMMYWLDKQGDGYYREYVPWLDEGITELLSQQKTREKGFAPSYISYVSEVMAAIFIQRLVGERTLRIAYLSGDYSEVKRKIEMAFGDELFDDLLSKKDAGPALSMLAKEVSQNDLTQLFQDCNTAWKRPFRKDKDIERAAKKALEIGKK